MYCSKAIYLMKMPSFKWQCSSSHSPREACVRACVHACVRCVGRCSTISNMHETNSCVISSNELLICSEIFGECSPVMSFLGQILGHHVINCVGYHLLELIIHVVSHAFLGPLLLRSQTHCNVKSNEHLRWFSFHDCPNHLQTCVLSRDIKHRFIRNSS